MLPGGPRQEMLRPLVDEVPPEVRQAQRSSADLATAARPTLAVTAVHVDGHVRHRCGDSHARRIRFALEMPVLGDRRDEPVDACLSPSVHRDDHARIGLAGREHRGDSTGLQQTSRHRSEPAAACSGDTDPSRTRVCVRPVASVVIAVVTARQDDGVVENRGRRLQADVDLDGLAGVGSTGPKPGRHKPRNRAFRDQAVRQRQQGLGVASVGDENGDASCANRSVARTRKQATRRSRPRPPA